MLSYLSFVFLGTVIKEVPLLNGRLREAASIMKCSLFEPAIVKVQQNESGSMTSEQKEAIAGLHSDAKCTGEISDTTLFLSQIAMRPFREKQNGASNYVELQFIIPSSNICKRHFLLPSTQCQTDSGQWHRTILNVSCFCTLRGVFEEYQASTELFGDNFLVTHGHFVIHNAVFY